MSSTTVNRLLQLVRTRRTYYALTKHSPIPHDRIEHLVKEALVYTPSSFNSQSTRVIVLFGAHHDRFWDIVTAILKSKVPSDRREPTSQKMAMFKEATGTARPTQSNRLIMFFEDQDVVTKSIAQFPSYASHFGMWASQSDAMIQYIVWLALDAEGLGVNLQHYNPIVDAKVMDEWNVPMGWKLNAQMVFGGKTGTPPEKEFMPLEERYKVFGE